MSGILAVWVDDAVQLEFDHAKQVPQRQLEYLDNMDARMDEGVSLDGETIPDPDIESRVKFVAQNMAAALLEGNDGLAVAMCTWLGVRRPELQQVRITVGNLGVTVDLDYEHPYEKPAPQPQVVHFDPHKLNS
jgi:hypothetical protein